MMTSLVSSFTLARLTARNFQMLWQFFPKAASITFLNICTN
ncbi:MAG TPA: hypothetical protein VIX58_11255 [Anaerolineae bacterium]